MAAADPWIMAATDGSVPGAGSDVMPENARLYVTSPVGATLVTARSNVIFIAGRSIGGSAMPAMFMVRPMASDMAPDVLKPAGIL